jgi:hypothetical protein
MWRSDHPTEDEPTVKLCADVWPTARQAIETGDLADADIPKLVEFFQASCRWRVHFASTQVPLSDDARAAASIITCAARLVLMDAVNGDEGKLGSLREALAHWRGSVRDEELYTLRRFAPSPSRTAWRDAAVKAAGTWFERHFEKAWPEAWAQCAALMLVHRVSSEASEHHQPVSPSDAPAESAEADEAFLRFASEMDADCCLRCMCVLQLRNFAVASSDKSQGASYYVATTDEEVAAARAWLRSKTVNAGESLLERARETMFRASLPPWGVRRMGARKPSACFMEFTRNEDRARTCAKGLRLCHVDPSETSDQTANTGSADIDEHDLGLLLLACASYFIEQNCAFRIDDKLVVLDNDPRLLRARFLAHRGERVLSPPPLLLRTCDATYIAHRRREPGAYDAVHAHPTLARGVIAWLKHLHDVRGGVLFLDRKVGGFVDDMLGRKTRQTGGITLETRGFA